MGVQWRKQRVRYDAIRLIDTIQLRCASHSLNRFNSNLQNFDNKSVLVEWDVMCSRTKFLFLLFGISLQVLTSS